ncbi:MAG: WS/DGAT domain-containing protein [Candidatus Nanopelagicales bacterium]|jgi:WS/DGAT/MGAT family acyltransferase|nr:WS/DGAT domain-containing protein [Candidatus Nanopelagicales bacterium]
MSDDRLDRMGAFDAVMWGVEQDPVLRSVIVAMTVLDSEPEVDVLVERITRMTLAVPKLRQRVIGNPVSPIPPRWEVDPNFDLTFHLQRFHVPADGTDRPLMRIAEQMAEQDFDRDRPLWAMALVQGWDGDRSAVIIKLHHAITDGVGGMAMAASLFDLTRTPSTDLGPLPPEPTGNVLGLAGRIVNGVRFTTSAAYEHGRALAGGAIGLVERVAADPGESAVSGAAFAQSAARLLAPANEPLSPLMRGRSLTVRMAVVQVPFRPFKAASKAVGATLNDTYMAAVAGGVAAYHEAHNAPCDYVRVNMPVNMRTSSDSTAGNRWVPARFPMPIDSGDPVTRIKRLSPLLTQARTEPALMVSDTIYRLLTALPQSAATSVASGMMKGCDLAITNVPGPPIALYASGSAVQAIVPFAPKGGAAVNVGLMTYHGTAYIGINIDTRAVPDPDAFVEFIRAAFDDVLAIADPDAHAVLGLHSGTPVTEPTGAKPARRAPAKKAPAAKAAAKKAPAAKKSPAKKAPAAKAAPASTPS